jgi:hypothetical protein
VLMRESNWGMLATMHRWSTAVIMESCQVQVVHHLNAAAVKEDKEKNGWRWRSTRHMSTCHLTVIASRVTIPG